MINAIHGIVATPTMDIVRTSLVLELNAKSSISYPGSGDVWFDLSGNSNNFTRNSTNITYNSSGWWNFDGTTSQGQFMGAASSVVQRSGSFSFSFVVKHGSTFLDKEQLIANASGTDGYRIGFSNTGQMYYLISGAGGNGFQEGFIGGSGIGNGSVHYLVWVFDRSSQLGTYAVRGFQNGTQVGSATISSGASGNTTFSNNTASIGYQYCCALLRGQIYHALAYNKALTSSEITQNYNALKSSFNIA